MSTRTKILLIRQKTPGIQPIEIARQIKRSRQLVSIYLQEAGLPTKFYKPKRFCQDCGIEVDKEALRCRQCDSKARHSNAVVQLTCDCGCGQVFEREAKTVRMAKKLGRKHTFCNRHCFGRWLGKNYGASALRTYHRKVKV